VRRERCLVAPGQRPGLFFYSGLRAERDLNDFRRNAEPSPYDAGTEHPGDDQMAVILDDVTVGEARDVF
jgi:hypothetical protein